MAKFTIFGQGNMAQAISAVVSKGQNDVQFVTRADANAATIEGDIVVLAVPYFAVSEIVENYGTQFAGKTIIDISNPLNFETFDSLVVPTGSSAAAEIQKALPQSSVLKAFNTNFAATLGSQQVGANTTTVLVAGDDSTAKSAFISALEGTGVAALDAGSLARAHELEAIGFLQLTLAVSEKIGWTGGFALVK